MKYDHVVKYNGIYYNAWEDVPIDEAGANEPLPFTEDDEISDSEVHKYTYDELYGMTVKEVRSIAENLGFTINKTLKDDVVHEFLTKQM